MTLVNARCAKTWVTYFSATCFVSANLWAADPAPAPPAAAPAPAAPVPAAPLADALKGTAKDDYESGKLLYADGDYAGAALKFHTAYDSAKDPRLLWNVAAAEKEQRHYSRVESLLTQYLRESGAGLASADRADAEALLDTVRSFIGDVTITSDQSGASVSVDDTDIGTTPLPGPVRLDMGDRTIRLKKAGFKLFESKRTVVGRAALQISAVLIPDVHQGQLRITTQSDASIRLDGRMVGAGLWEGTLTSGIHRVAITAPGCRPYATDVAVADDREATLRIDLEAEVVPVVDAPRSSHSWLLVPAGVLIFAGLGVGGYLLLKPKTEGRPPPVEGSLYTLQL